MGFDIKDLHIDEASPAGRMLDRIVRREGVTPEEAVRQVLDRAVPRESRPDDIFGLFSSPEDQALMDDVMTIIRENRDREIQVMRERLTSESEL